MHCKRRAASRRAARMMLFFPTTRINAIPFDLAFTFAGAVVVFNKFHTHIEKKRARHNQTSINIRGDTSPEKGGDESQPPPRVC